VSAQDKYNAPFPSNLRAIINERGTTITALARDLGITRQAVSQYADGTGQPNADKLKRIADYFDVSADWLLGRAGGVKSLNSDIVAVGKYTGLSESAIEFLHSIQGQEKQLDVISAIISDDNFPIVIKYILEIIDAKIESELDKWGVVNHGDEVEKTEDGGRIIRGLEHELFLEYMVETCIHSIVENIADDAIYRDCLFE